MFQLKTYFLKFVCCTIPAEGHGQHNTYFPISFSN